MRLALVVSSLGRGGAEHTLVELSRSFIARGEEVTLITLAAPQAGEWLLDAGVRRLALGTPVGAGSPFTAPGRLLARWRALRKVLVELRPDVVMSFIDETNVLVLLACAGSGIPVVVGERIDPRNLSLRAPWRLVRRLAYPRAAAVIVQTQSVRTWAQSFLPPDRVHVIPNFPLRLPDEGEITPEPRRLPLVLGIGRLSPQKGFHLLIEAFASCAMHQPDWRLVILGEGPERGALERRVASLGLSERISLPGFNRHPETILREAAIFALSSRFEGFPNVLLEAMAWGLPSVSFDCPSGPSEIVRHGVDGLLVPREDVTALALALEQLMADDELRRRMGRSATEVRERFSRERIVQLYLDLFGRVSGNPLRPQSAS